MQQRFLFPLSNVIVSRRSGLRWGGKVAQAAGRGLQLQEPLEASNPERAPGCDWGFSRHTLLHCAAGPGQFPGCASWRGRVLLMAGHCRFRVKLN